MTSGQHGESTIAWEPPGPGTWELDTSHFDATVSRAMRDLMSEAAPAGLAEGMELAGGPLKTMDVGWVNGRFYRRLVPLVGGGRDMPTPPKAVLWLVSRIHPAFRRRAKRSNVALSERYWNAEFARWEDEWKPQLIDANRQFGEVDVAELNDAELIDHVRSLWTHVRWAARLHFRLHTSDLGPIGLLMVAAEDAGLDQTTAMATLSGSSPATSAPAVAARAIGIELASVRSSATTLDDIRNASPEAAVLLDRYLDDFGHRLTTGYDLRDQTLAELPDVVVAAIANADLDADPARDAEERGRAARNAFMADVPVERRAEFVELVDDARRLYGLRDENGPLTVEWPTGVLRLAVLEIAERLISVGRLDAVEHIFDASIDEMLSLLGGGATPSAAELATRCSQRMAHRGHEAPLTLGRPAETPDVDVLPGRMPEMMRAVLAVTTLIEPEPHAESEGADMLSGTGIGDVVVRGTARVVADADEAFDRVEPGDIIVTRFTAPTFNSVLAMSSGVVTEGGGLLCHTAVIARELGIPAVVGVPGALTEILDGAEIEIDPISGRVRVLAPS